MKCVNILSLFISTDKTQDHAIAYTGISGSTTLPSGQKKKKVLN
jgi:hypothetical protein